MSFLIYPPGRKGKDHPKICPKTGKVIQHRRKHRWVWWLFPFTGLAALIWFLVRVIPKPSRATYPCQRVAFPLASGFVIWLLGLVGSAAAFHKAKHSLARARYVLAAICIAASVGFIWAAMSSTDQKIIYAHEPRVANDALGTGIGVHPGRVAWIHDPNATDWAGPGSGQNWFSYDCTDQNVVNEMFSKALRALTGKSADYAAWDVIFRYFNQQREKGDVGYQPGEKIGIKINMTLMFPNDPNMDKITPDWWTGPSFTDLTDNSPQLTIALLDQLVNVVGVNQSDISIGDPGRMLASYWYNIVHSEFPNVVYIASVGGNGRTEATYSTIKFYWSTLGANGKTQDYIPTPFANAAYFINFSILKSHDDGGITVGGKNNYGSLRRNPDTAGYYNMHLTRATERPGMGHYRAIVDLMGHPNLGGKTLISLIDGLYTGQGWASVPVKWNMSPFNNDWPSSIIVSQDQVAADSVGDDFLYTEWTTFPRKSGADDYLHEAALIPTPPSGTNYDPNDDGGLTESLGVHEHWNDPNLKQYTRNLGTGTGIELVTSAPGNADIYADGFVDFKDFAVFAAAWRSQPGDGNWNAACDISMPADNIIDELDLDILCENWLD